MLIKKIPLIYKLIIITSLFICLLGFISAFKMDASIYEEKQTSFVMSFLYAFCLNYWLIFLIWLIGSNKALSLLSFILGFIKCFMIGRVLGATLKMGNFISNLRFYILDLFLLLPIIVFLLSTIINKNIQKEEAEQAKRIMTLITVTILLILYSFLSAL